MAKETDFIPVYDRKIRTDGTIINVANGLNVDGSRNVALTGRGALEQTFYNALAVRDTLLATSPVLSLANISGENFVLINNALDQAVTVNIYIKNSLGMSFVVFPGISVGAGAQKVLSRDDNGILACPIFSIYLTVQASVAPLTGGFTATIGGTQA
jgi:hypothetical protein